MKQEKLINWSVFILLSLIWGSSFILMKISKAELSGLLIAAIRIFSASVVFIPFAIIHFKKIPKNKIFLIIVTGIFGNLIPAFLYAAAIAANIDSSLVAILNSLTPLCVVVTGIILFKNKIKPIKIAGILIGFTGLCLLFLNRELKSENASYALLVLLATISYGFNVNFVSNYLKELNPVHIATVSLACMCIPAGFVLWQQHFLSLEFERSAVRWSVLASVFLGIAASSLGTVLFYILIKRAGGIFASLVTYGVPVIAIIWGIIFGEQVTLWQVGCLAIILGGVYLANK